VRKEQAEVTIDPPSRHEMAYAAPNSVRLPHRWRFVRELWLSGSIDLFVYLRDVAFDKSIVSGAASSIASAGCGQHGETAVTAVPRIT
jgi:hypothetical protein